jgi:uncharacterized protein (DUF58 family)
LKKSRLPQHKVAPPARPDLKKLIEELEYSVDFKVRSIRPGKWSSRGRYGGGYSFEKFETLSNHADFRRIDFLARARNPFVKEPLVRVSRPTVSIDVIMLADLSLSLVCGFSESKLFQIAKLSTMLGYTAAKRGDRFGFLGFDRRLIEPLCYTPRLSKTIGLEIGEEVLDRGASFPSGGLRLDLEPFLPVARSLIVFVSDFYFDPEELRGVLSQLSRHRVLPIMLRQAREREWPRNLWGFLRLRDSEEEKDRLCFFSRATIRRFREKARQNEEAIAGILRSVSSYPMLLDEITPHRFLQELDKTTR